MRSIGMKNKIKELANTRGALTKGYINLNFTKETCTIVDKANKTKTTLPLNEAYEHILSHSYIR